MTIVSLVTTVCYLVTFIPIAIIQILRQWSEKYRASDKILVPLTFLNPLLDPLLCIISLGKLREHTISDLKKL